MGAKDAPPIARDWLAKSLAGTLLGFTLALGCSGLFLRGLPGMVPVLRTQLAMWMVVPIWMGLLGGCFVFRDGLRAWLWLGVGNLIVWSVPLARLLF